MSLIMRRLVALSVDGIGLLDNRGFFLFFLWKMFSFGGVSYSINEYGIGYE